MLKIVEQEIKNHERKFFEDEDSEAENQLMSDLMNPTKTIKEHNDRLEQFKLKSHIQQFWTIPMSENVKDIQWKKLAEK